MRFNEWYVCYLVQFILHCIVPRPSRSKIHFLLNQEINNGRIRKQIVARLGVIVFEIMKKNIQLIFLRCSKMMLIKLFLKMIEFRTISVHLNNVSKHICQIMPCILFLNDPKRILIVTLTCEYCACDAHVLSIMM